MFLDDQLIEILESVNYKHWKDRSTVEAKMIEITLNYIHDKCNGKDELPLIMKRAKNYWYSALKRFEKKSGVKVFQEGSFENFIKTSPIFSDIKERILEYIK